ncbi:N-acetylglucosamine-6-phosphate deacetylase [Roseobacter sp. S98]|uniref:N-acetylglucosamine-6-phosphate deacetylase n=1 Tax=Roseobacter algicola (ex Choi et al. 2025) (nom. illeg.) TaxID=3092138 RepID=UPI0035C6A0EF
MTAQTVIFRNGRIFDGSQLHDGAAVRFSDGVLSGIVTAPEDDPGAYVIDLDGDILSPGYTDIQVNGGDGLMFNDAPTTDTLRRMAQAHRWLGVTHLLPTLITDTRDITQGAIDAACAAVEEKIPGIAGLHLEGPHLSVARKGAHDPALIRPMEADDLDLLLETAGKLPVLKVTIAPENVTEDQVTALARAGVLVSLGHTDADFATCIRFFKAGARCATHLFNAMSQIGNREPGLAGAALTYGEASAGLIADGIHVHSDVIRIAWQSKQGPGKLFLVSDAMAVAGTDTDAFLLNGRSILRRDGQLRLSDGTLAGADLDLTKAVSVLVNQVGVPLDQALAAATTTPAGLCRIPGCSLRPNATRISEVIRIRQDLSGLVQHTVDALGQPLADKV